MRTESQKEELIITAEGSRISYWAKKWGLASRELNDAILETGSLRVAELRNYFRAKCELLSVQGLLKYFRLAFS
jgi:hypothetical protein